jgi:hypothetical protein
MCEDTAPAQQETPAPYKGWPIQELWVKYEEIAMHFNDLIMRLRTQALGAVAALSLVGLFAKADLGTSGATWEIAGLVFSSLGVFWIAIWILDFFYYNQLLIGAIAALLELEKESATSATISRIRMSTFIEEAVYKRTQFKYSKMERLRLAGPRWAFYGLVFSALVLGASFSFHEHANLAPKPVSTRAMGEQI